MSLTLTPLLEIPLINPGDDLVEIVGDSLHRSEIKICDGDILVFTQKIISKAEGRLVNLNDVVVSKEARKLSNHTQKDARLVELILKESREILRTRPGLIIVEHRLGFVCANAGIDHSNIIGSWGDPEDWVLLLPENPDKSSEKLRRKICEEFGKKIGVMIIDSHGRAWRNGSVGVCIGLSGLPGVVNLCGEKDLFGSELRATEIGVADELAAAASLVMGQAAEGSPVVHIRGFPYPLEEAGLSDLLRPKSFDMFR